MDAETTDRIACKFETQALYCEQQIELLRTVAEKLLILESNGAPEDPRKRIEAIIHDLEITVKYLDEELKYLRIK